MWVRDVTWADQSVRQELAALKKAGPFVYGLTNYVAANLSANVLLAVGAGPAIGAAPGWPTAFAAGAGAMWINTAALMSSSPETLLEAARSANAAGTPWVLDPVAVGAGATAYDDVVHALLAFHPTVIRGNASELIALSGGGAGGKGVETTANAAEAIDFIKSLATTTKSIVAVSGPIDYITDGVEVFSVPGGDVRLTKVTGAGCSLGALIAAMLAAGSSPLAATCAAHAIYAVAAERAGAMTKGTASFGAALVDELSLLDPAE
nr:hydroxyethylthiazole kinase [Acidisoma sp. PAMC 29798]